jgi:asparagine synthase (glutamine-hydrolysing)
VTHYLIKKIFHTFNLGKNRGPEYSKLLENSENEIFGFHRLAINGIDEGSHQPLQVNDIQLIANGFIYNYKQLFNKESL